MRLTKHRWGPSTILTWWKNWVSRPNPFVSFLLKKILLFWFRTRNMSIHCGFARRRQRKFGLSLFCFPRKPTYVYIIRPLPKPMAVSLCSSQKSQHNHSSVWWRVSVPQISLTHQVSTNCSLFEFVNSYYILSPLGLFLLFHFIWVSLLTRYRRWAVWWVTIRLFWWSWNWVGGY